MCGLQKQKTKIIDVFNKFNCTLQMYYLIHKIKILVKLITKEPISVKFKVNKKPFVSALN